MLRTVLAPAADQERLSLRPDAQRDTLNLFNHEGTHHARGNSERLDFSQAKASHMGQSFSSRAAAAPLSASFRVREDKSDIETLLRSCHQGQLDARMSVEEPVIQIADPMVSILAAFYLIPNDYQNELFDDFREAAEAHDLRSLLDTISDWSATAQLYDHPTLASDLRDAIGGREGVADWLPG